MNLKSYLESGLLELYALNLLDETERAGVERAVAAFPELQHALHHIERSLEAYASSAAITPPLHVQHTVIETLADLAREQAMDLNDLPLISRFSNYRNWLRLVDDYIPRPFPGGLVQKVLQRTGKVMQTLIVSSVDIPEEYHQDVYESFLILEGRCECTLSGRAIFMEAGDFMEIPLDELHDVKLLTPHVAAILQHLNV